MSAHNELEYLPWDSAHFGFGVGRIMARGIPRARLEELLRKASERGLGLVEAFCSIEDEAGVQALESAGFCFAGVKVHLDKRLEAGPWPQLPEGYAVRKALPDEAGALGQTFGGLYADSRYRVIAGVDAGKTRALYTTWIEKSVRGDFDDACLLLHAGATPVGLCTLRLDADLGHVGLFGVTTAYSGRGLGGVLLDLAGAWLRAQGIRAMAIATHARNISAVRLCERSGFQARRMEMCMYRRLP